MTINIYRTELDEILSLRSLFLYENNFQIRYNACHERGWSDSYIIEYDGARVGYSAIKGAENLESRDTIFEFYLIPPYKQLYSIAFEELLRIADVRFIECQSNDQLLTSILYQFGNKIQADTILFEDSTTTFVNKEGVVFRSRHEDDKVFKHKREPVGEYVLECSNEIVATGGFALHYNLPFADLYMEVNEVYQRKGLGSFFIQELKKECYLNGRVPAARCSIDNAASKATLLKAGLKIAGYMLLGNVTHKVSGNI
jgi:GNAT superfamily N-acetyltransferase